MKKTIFKDKNRLVMISAALILVCTLSLLLLRSTVNGKNHELISIMEGTSVETQMHIIKGKAPGKNILVITGIHGDEAAGIMAGEALKEIRGLESGTLLIISPANTQGAREHVRNTEQYRDLNRSFPGDKNRDLTDQLAAAIFQTVKDYTPDIVLDLHEASREEGTRDFLGNSLIFTDLTGMEELVSGLVLDTQNGALCSSPFTYFGPAPAGSINREVTEQLSVPVLTIETSEEDNMENRIANHLALLHAVMQYYDLEK